MLTDSATELREVRRSTMIMATIYRVPFCGTSHAAGKDN
jgi:hypothetical protein